MIWNYVGYCGETISFQNTEYPCRYLFFSPENTTYTISVESLNNALLKNSSEYVSSEARLLDDKIFFFVPDEYIERDEKFLCDFITENIL